MVRSVLRGAGFFFCFLVIPIYAENTVNTDSPIRLAGVPPGFQFLLEKQTTAIDVFYGDVYLTTTLASYTPTTIQFQNPEEVVAGLKNLITPEQIAQGLTGEIDSHAGEVCYRDTDVDCGVLTPDNVGVIFDESRFRADIFINPNLLSLQGHDFTKYLPASDSAFSSVNNLSLLYTGGDMGEEQMALNGQSLFSLKEQRVVSEWAYVDNPDAGKYNIDTLYWQMDKADFQYQAGLFYSENRYLSFIPSIDVLGFRYSTSLKARTDLSFANGSPIQLYLPSRSRVNIYKDGKFLSTAFYNPGNQLLDTSNLPDGAYDIEMRIIDSAGREEVVTRFFVKTQRLAPVDQDLYFVEVGDIQKRDYGNRNGFSESMNIPIVQGGYSHRLAESIGLNAGASATDDELVSEFGLYHINDYFDVEPKVLLGAQGEYGWSFNGFGRFYEYSASYQFRRVWSDNKPLDLDFHLVPTWLKQHMFALGRPLWDGYLQFRYSVSDREKAFDFDDGSRSAKSLIFNKALGFGSGRYNFYSELTETNDDSLVVFGFDWYWRDSHLYHSINADVRHEKTVLSGKDDYLQFGYNGNWVDGNLRPEDVSVSWNARADRNNAALGANSSIQSNLGAAEFAFTYNDNSLGDNSFIYGGQLSTSVAGEAGEWGLGGKNPGQGALVLEIDSDAYEKDTTYDVLINNMKYGAIKANQKVIVPVAPYQTYKITVADKGTQFVSFSQGEKIATIYPGNVKSFKWQARSIGVLITRVVSKLPGCFNDIDEKCWGPLINARAKGVNDFAVTDADGYIQTEVYQSEKTFTLIKKGEECTVDFSDVEFEDGFAYSDKDLKCYGKESMKIIP